MQEAERTPSATMCVCVWLGRRGAQGDKVVMEKKYNKNFEKKINTKKVILRYVIVKPLKTNQVCSEKFLLSENVLILVLLRLKCLVTNTKATF